MNDFITWFDTHNGFSTFIVTFCLLGITGFYAFQTRKQAKDSHRMLEETRKQMKREEKRMLTSAINYIFLISTEMRSHENAYASYLWFHCIDGNPNIIKDPSDNNLDVMRKYLCCSVWNEIKSDSSKIFSNKLMQELVHYYEIVDNILNGNEENLIEAIEVQLVYMYRCFKTIESEFNINYKRDRVHEYFGERFIIDKDKGILVRIE